MWGGRLYGHWSSCDATNDGAVEMKNRRDAGKASKLAAERMADILLFEDKRCGREGNAE